MPKLPEKTLADVKRYIPLRFSHMSDDWIKLRIRKVIRKLKTEPLSVQKKYADQVDHFFKINAQVLKDAEANSKGVLQPAVINKALNMDSQEMIDLVYKCGGNVNVAMDILNGDYDKQH